MLLPKLRFVGLAKLSNFVVAHTSWELGQEEDNVLFQNVLVWDTLQLFSYLAGNHVIVIADLLTHNQLISIVLIVFGAFGFFHSLYLDTLFLFNFISNLVNAFVAADFVNHSVAKSPWLNKVENSVLAQVYFGIHKGILVVLV